MPLLVAPSLTLLDRLEIQRQRINTGEYQPLGKIKVILTEIARDSAVVVKEARRAGRRLDFMNEGPMLALSHDHKDLLIIPGIPSLPAIPDPDWVPRFHGDKCPMLAQRFADRADGTLEDQWLVFQPIAQVAYVRFSPAAFRLINMRDNEADGTQMSLLIDPSNGQAHFVGGRFLL